ncbi:phage DNA encapsidation protein [Bartonella taylorii]|uniref:phage DNA encapsidation protein n=1 Tax=Bartonella taylorii TaxID=33046 RepID=UPI001ABB5864|nr:phage DNA encapsidation protein [Bartonella taylorii]
MGDKELYYDLNKALSYNALWNFLDSNRGLGKTFSTLRFVCNAYKKRNEQFIYVRRTKEEIGRVKDEMFIALENQGIIKPFEFRCEGDCILYNPEIHLDELKKFCQGRGETEARISTKRPYRKPSIFKAKNDTLCGYLIPLSLVNQYKHCSFSNVKTIIFEEYICEQGKYLKNEPEKLVSLCESVFRHRDGGRIICLGNNVSQSNPYFDFFDLRNHHKNEFTFFREQSILIGHTLGKEFAEKKVQTKFAKSIKDTAYGSFVLDNNALNINDDYSFIDKMKSIPKRPYFNLIIQNQKLAVFFASDKLFIKKGFNKDYITYSMDNTLYEGAIKGSISKDRKLKQLAKFIRYGDVCFETMDVKRVMQPFIKKV